MVDHRPVDGFSCIILVVAPLLTEVLTSTAISFYFPTFFIGNPVGPKQGVSSSVDFRIKANSTFTVRLVTFSYSAALDNTEFTQPQNSARFVQNSATLLAELFL